MFLVECKSLFHFLGIDFELTFHGKFLDLIPCKY